MCNVCLVVHGDLPYFSYPTLQYLKNNSSRPNQGHNPSIYLYIMQGVFGFNLLDLFKEESCCHHSFMPHYCSYTLIHRSPALL